MSKFITKLLHADVDAAKVAAPIVAGAVGGPAAGAAVGAAVKAGSAAMAKKPVTPSPTAEPRPNPLSASNIDEARMQDKARMKTQYGI